MARLGLAGPAINSNETEKQMNPYSASLQAHLEKDMAHEKEQDRWDLRKIAVEQRAAEIINDPQELSDATGDVIWNGREVAQENYSRLLCRMATASPEHWEMFRGEFQELHKQIATEYAENDVPLPALLRRQGE